MNSFRAEVRFTSAFAKEQRILHEYLVLSIFIRNSCFVTFDVNVVVDALLRNALFKEVSPNSRFRGDLNFRKLSG